MKEFREINDAYDKCCQLAFTQPVHDNQRFLLTDASSESAGYAVFTEDEPKIYVNTQNLCPKSLRSQNIYCPPNNMSINVKQL